MRACGDSLALVIPAHQVGRDRESLEVFGSERDVTIGGLQPPIRFGPRILRESFTATLERLRVAHVPFTQMVDRECPIQ